MTVKQPPQLYTFDDFREFIALPENEDRLFEFIDGEINEVSPGRTRNSGYGHHVVVKVHNFCEHHNLPCFTSGGDGAYSIQGHTVAPDFAYKRTPLSDEYPDPEPPLWVIEVISPTDKGVDIRKKRRIYREAGILLWEMYPSTESIDVYAAGKPEQEFGINDVLDVGDILPGFTLAVRDIFKR